MTVIAYAAATTAAVLAGYLCLALGTMAVANARGWYQLLHCSYPQICPRCKGRVPGRETSRLWTGLKKVEPYLTAPLLVFGFTLLKARIKLVQTQ